MNVPAPGSLDLPTIRKRRRLRIAMGHEAAVAEARHRIAALPGVIAVLAEGPTLRVDYNLLQVRLRQIEAVAEEAGLAFKEGWHGLCRGFWKFTEQNELDNVIHAGKAACCSRPPARLK